MGTDGKWPALLLGALLAVAPLAVASAADVEPWRNPNHAIVIDAYEMNEIDWPKMLTDKRITGFISKASDGLPESFDCKGEHDGDTVAHCKTMWRKYAVSRELYETRRLLARAHGLLWGAYHLARPGNPVDQANHFLDYTKPQADEMMVLDIEGIDPEKFMSLEDAQIFAGHIRTRTGRYPVLYTNHTTAKHIAANRHKYRILSRLPLWYARYKPGIRNVFPLGNWENYTLWQFSAAANCNKRRCPYRVKGTFNDIDVNVAPMDRTALTKIWAHGDLVAERPFDADKLPPDEMVTASIPRAAAVDEPKSLRFKGNATGTAGLAVAAQASLKSAEPDGAAGFRITLAVTTDEEDTGPVTSASAKAAAGD